MAKKKLTSWLHLKTILRHVRLAYSTQLPRRILTLSAIATLIFWSTAIWQYYNWSKQKDIAHQRQLTTHILDQFQKYETVLLGCNSFFNASNLVTDDEWSEYINGLQIQTNYPALTDVAIIEYRKSDVTSNQQQTLSSHPDDWSAIIQKRFCIRQEKSQEIKRFDTSKLIRNKLLESANSGNIVCLPSMTAWQCSEKSTTLMIPLYQKSNDTKRHKSLTSLYGWIAIAMDLDILIKHNRRNMLNGEEIDLIYVDQTMLKHDQVSLENLQSHLNLNESQTTHRVAGGVWAVHIIQQESTQQNLVFLLLGSILFAGLLISLR